MTQWHPLFAKLLRPVLEGYYEVQVNVPVGDVPRAADVLLLRRTTQSGLPFPRPLALLDNLERTGIQGTERFGAARRH